MAKEFSHLRYRFEENPDLSAIEENELINILRSDKESDIVNVVATDKVLEVFNFTQEISQDVRDDIFHWLKELGVSNPTVMTAEKREEELEIYWGVRGKKKKK